MLNAQLANALGRPDLVYSASSASVGPSPTVVATSAGSSGGDAPGSFDSGRISLMMLMALIGAYAAFTWWVRPYLS